MKISDDLAALLADSLKDAVLDLAAPHIAEIQLVTIRKAAELLGVGETKARSLIREYVDLGEKSPRVRLSTLRRLIDERTVPT
jgi:hypothetical protein